MITALGFCWAALGALSGKRLAPIMAELVPTLRRFRELMITDEMVAVAMSPAAIDRHLAAERAKVALRRHSHTKPGSLLKSQIPIGERNACASAMVARFALPRSWSRVRADGPACTGAHVART